VSAHVIWSPIRVRVPRQSLRAVSWTSARARSTPPGGVEVLVTPSRVASVTVSAAEAVASHAKTAAKRAPTASTTCVRRAIAFTARETDGAQPMLIITCLSSV
jgi:hypothetical protein